ncbi:MAG: glycosyltransferase family 4 protein [Candidatus Nealsonbacteria bacterium]
MKLLIITQKIDILDDNLGFFHRWVEKFAEDLEEVFVICLAQGKHNLPENVHVFSLGKERGVFKIVQLFLLQKYLLKILPKVDGVFAHMCPIYVVASFPLVKFFRKKMVLWFLHKSVTWKLKFAAKVANGILTASEKSCRLKDRKKIKIVGHGIDVESFKPAEKKLSSDFVVFSAGRIAPSKDLETLIRAVKILVAEKKLIDLKVEIAGTPLISQEKKYLEKLNILVKENGLENHIKFLGGIPNYEMPGYYQKADIFINLSRTGSMDKAVLEAMACGTLILTCNEAYQNILEEKYLFNKKDSRNLSEKIMNLKNSRKDVNLRQMVVNNHSLDNLIRTIINEFKI